MQEVREKQLIRWRNIVFIWNWY